MVRYVIAVKLLLLLIVFVGACGSREAVEIKEREPVVQKSSTGAGSFEQKWQELIKAAQKEGTVVIFNSGTFVGARDAIVRAFKARYGINIDFTAGGSMEIEERIYRERRSGIYAVDVRTSGSTTYYLELLPKGIVEPLEPVLMLPEVTDPKMWIGGQLPYRDPEKKSIAFSAHAQPQFLYNTNLVKPEEFKSFRDLLNPRWKGKVAMHDPRGPGAGQMAVSMIGSTLLGWDAIRELVNQDPFITRDHYLLVDGVAKGKYAIAAFIQISRGVDAEKAGAPVKMVVLSDAVHSGASGTVVGLIKNMPHPNAAKLFLNWLLSKEGQMTVYKEIGVPSARLDVPAEGISPVLLLDPNRRYATDDLEWSIKQPERDVEINKIFSPLFK